jgi:hypothetical protein
VDRNRQIQSVRTGEKDGVEMNAQSSKAMLLALRDRGQGGFVMFHPEMIERVMGGFLADVGRERMSKAEKRITAKDEGEL